MFEFRLPTLGLAVLFLASIVRTQDSEGLAATPIISNDLPIVSDQSDDQKIESLIKDEWTRLGNCFDGRGGNRDKGKTFCAFSKPTFNNGQGLSIITTQARLDALKTRPVFSGGEGENATPSIRYEAKEIPGKGIGLMVTEPIRDGQLIMAHTPTVMVDGRALGGGIQREEAAKLLGQAVKALPEASRKEYMNMSTHDRVTGYEDHVLKAFLTNAFQTGMEDDYENFHSIYAETARINHECRPNCAYQFDYKTLTHKVYAARDIAVGEELSVSYIDPVRDFASRQRKLNKEWGFKCTCSHCSAEAHVTAESDDRVAQIRELILELDDYTARSGATPEKAELLIHLSKLDDMWARLYELYYRAALEYNGVERKTEAVAHARTCLQRALTLRGPDHSVIKSMRALVQDPEKHWSWRFRFKIAEKAAQAAKKEDPDY